LGLEIQTPSLFCHVTSNSHLEEIRAYWTRQWQEFDPRPEPMEVIDREGGQTQVKV
jgi:hypothetical protein